MVRITVGIHFTDCQANERLDVWVAVLYARAMSTLRAAQKRMTYELFLDKGLELFGEKGYAATTVDDIASAAGSTRTTFYLHFASKAELMSALLERVDTILTAADDPPLTEVVAVRVARADPDVHRPEDHAVGRDQALPDRSLPGGPRAGRRRADRGVVPGSHRWTSRGGSTVADRFPADSRRMRAILAFGQLEYVSRRYFAVGWTTVERESASRSSPTRGATSWARTPDPPLHVRPHSRRACPAIPIMCWTE